MQETQYEDLDGEIKKCREFFESKNEDDLKKAMDKRLDKLKSKGHTLVRICKIGRNQPCPCMSGKKFKKCCIDKVKHV